MKKTVCILLALLLLLAGCGNTQAPSERLTIKIATLAGPTGMGMVQLLDADPADKANNYEFVLTNAPDEVAPMVITGEIDIAALPTNMASVLYNRTEGGVTILAVNALGVLYLLSTKDTADLAGRTIYATGQGATPEYTLNHILAQNGLVLNEDVFVEYKSQHAELASLLAAGEVDLAMLPEPFVTTVTNQTPDLNIVMDLTEEWEQVTDNTPLTTGCIVVRNEFLEEHPQAVAAFLEEYKASVDFVNGQPDEAAALIEKHEIVASAPVARQAIPRCNIVFLDGPEMKDAVSLYLNVLYEANPQSVGGALPDEAFYYQG